MWLNMANMNGELCLLLYRFTLCECIVMICDDVIMEPQQVVGKTMDLIMIP